MWNARVLAGSFVITQFHLQMTTLVNRLSDGISLFVTIFFSFTRFKIPAPKWLQ